MSYLVTAFKSCMTLFKIHKIYDLLLRSKYEFVLFFILFFYNFFLQVKKLYRKDVYGFAFPKNKQKSQLMSNLINIELFDKQS